MTLLSLKANNKSNFIILFLIFSAAFVLRFLNLGYSDYQGDETQAFFNPVDESFTQFLLNQRRAPVQFLITASLQVISHNYLNTFVTRFPFALAGFISCFLFFLVVKKLTNKKIAIYSLIFFVTNGLVVAFSRIVQYQSIVLLLTLTTLFLLLRLVELNQLKYLYLAAISWGLAFLTHSDAVFISPAVLVLLIWWTKTHKLQLKGSLVKLVMFSILTLTLILIFYGPFLLNLPKDTRNYWKQRLEGQKINNVISSSRYLFELYQPIYVVHIYTIAGIAGFILAAVLPSLKSDRWMAILKRIRFSSLSTGLNNYSLLILVLWFLFPFFVMEEIITIPGTHIWTYIVPLTILMGLFFNFMEEITKEWGRALFLFYRGAFLVLSVFLFLQSYFIFVDHTDEYPWQTSRFLMWTLPSPNPIFKLSLFGYPYNRMWQEVSQFVKEDGRSIYYSTNEKNSIAKFYLSNPFESNNRRAGYFIHVVDPQSFTNHTINARGAAWMEKNDPIRIWKKGEKEMVRVYYVPEQWTPQSEIP